MDIERSLVSKIIKTGDLVPVLESKIQPSFFEGSEHRKVFGWIIEYWNRYGECPTNKALLQDFPNYNLVKTEEPYQYYIDELRERRKYGIVVEGLEESARLLDVENDTDGALFALTKAVTKVGTEVSALRDTDLIETWTDRLENYEALKNLPGGLRGIPLGFPTIDYWLSGAQTEQLLTFVGLPKTGKSTMLMNMAISAHIYGKIPMFLSFEMSREEQEARHDAFRAKIDHLALLSGRLSKTDEDKLKRALRLIKNMHPFILSTDISSSTTLSGLKAKIEQYKPDIVFVDGVYLMDDEEGNAKGSPQALTNISRGMKRLCQTSRIPIVQTTQVLDWKVSKKVGITGGSIGYSSAFLQDSDVIMAVEFTEDANVVKVKIVEARNAPRKAVLVQWKWATGEFEELGETDEQEEQENDDEYIRGV